MPKTAKTKKFVVREGSQIFIDGPDGKSMKCFGGDVVELTAKLANHFDKHNSLKPFIEPEDDDAEETETETAEA